MIEDLRKQNTEPSQKWLKIDKTVRALEELRDEVQSVHLVPLISELKSASNSIAQEQLKINAKLKVEAEKCEHDFQYKGRDSHYDWYECVKCGDRYKD